MRVSDDRYTRDRQRLDLAQRFIRHEARTFTIRQWTGLSDDRIRKLYRSYVASNGSHPRGAPSRANRRVNLPTSSRNAELNFQAAQLSSLFLVYGLLVASATGLESRYHVGSFESGLLLCQVYEAYLDFHAPAAISFEHAWFLLIALTRREELGLARCAVCGGVRLRDLLSRRRVTCGTCEASALDAAGWPAEDASPIDEQDRCRP